MKATVLSDRDAEFDYQGGIVILPVALAKGIEFQAVLVVDASEENYSGEIEYDGRLLYVAITRALHHLNIYYYKELSGYLKPARQFASTQ